MTQLEELLEPPAKASAHDVMSNFDHSVDEGAEELLKANPDTSYGYAGWNFHGRVWWDAEGDRFLCAVKVFGSHVATNEAPSLSELMDSVSAEHGYD